MAAQQQYTFDLLTPFIALVAVLIPLLMVQRYIHRHLFGVGFLLAHDKGTATLFYYLLLMPGVFLHEFSQYLMAGVFSVRAHKYNLVPEAQEDGSLEMGFIELEEIKNPIFAAIIGVTPLVLGIVAVVLISNNLLDLPTIFIAIRTNDLTVIGAAFQMLVNKPDFLLWLYVLFAVSNTMMPSREGRRGWWIVAGAVLAFFVFLTVIGLEELVIEWLQGPVANAVYSLVSVLGTVLALDLTVASIIWVFERGVERVTGHKVEYQPALAAGNQAALAAQKGPKSVYDLRLPIPPAPGKAGKAPAKLPAKPAAAVGAPAAKPVFGAPATPAKPALGSGQAPQPARPAVGAGGTLARPGTPTPATPANAGGTFGNTGTPRPGGLSTPGAKPAAPTAASTDKPATPARPGVISGPPALTRPGATPTPAPKPSGTPATGARSSPFGSSRPKDDDYIEADVIDEEEEDEDNEPRYVDEDDT